MVAEGVFQTATKVTKYAAVFMLLPQEGVVLGEPLVLGEQSALWQQTGPPSTPPT